LPSKMMLPFLNSLVGLLAEGPGVEGRLANGTAFELPSILVAFLNDGQLTELTAASGVFDDQAPLSATSMDPNRKYVSSHFVTQRGTIAFERLTCKVAQGPTSSKTSTLTTRTTKATLVCSSSPTSSNCNRDNCFRQLLQSTAQVSSFCATYTASPQSATTGLPTYVSQCANSPARISSACSCIIPGTCTPTSTIGSTATATPAPSSLGTQTFVRILLNDAVYPVPSCRDGPGGSCLLSKYVDIVKGRLSNAGDLVKKCNVTATGGPSTIKGASFFTDLAQPWLATVAP
jgi:acid phosphatase